MSHQPPARRLDFSQDGQIASAQRLVPRAAASVLSVKKSVAKAVARPRLSGGGKKRAFDLSDSENEENLPASTMQETLDAGEPSAHDAVDLHVKADDNDYGGGDMEDLGVPIEDDEVQDLNPGVEAGKDDDEAGAVVDEDAEEDPNPKLKKQKEKSRRVEPEMREEEEEPVPKRKRGRPPKNKATSTVAQTSRKRRSESIEEDQEEIARPNKKSKKTSPAERNPNAKIVGSQAKGKAKESIESTSPKKPSTTNRPRPGGRTLLSTRSEEPSQDRGASVLLSGRTSVKPVAYWRGERMVYGEARKLEGGAIDLPSLRSVVRTEEIVIPPSKRKAGTGRRGGRPKGSRRRLDDIDEESEEEGDEDAQEWETDPGVLVAEVMAWDPVGQRGDDTVPEEVDLALAPLALSSLLRPVKDSNFRFAKALTLPFFHSGMVELPPGSQKRPKNPRKNHMVFFVSEGRVDVDVAGNSFSIGRGGMWQVPRGMSDLLSRRE
jgi:centromere protein C